MGLLGDLVGQVIREQGGDTLFDLVESARHAAIRRRETSSGGTEELASILEHMSAAKAGELVRAFSIYFQVANLAERVHRVRRGREWMPDSTARRSAVQFEKPPSMTFGTARTFPSSAAE